MKNNSTLLLLGTIIRATSRLNILRFSSDKKMRNRALNSIVGVVVLWALLMGLCIAYAYGLVLFGMGDSIPAFTAIVIIIMSFLFTLLKAGGYLFELKDYEMLVSMPFSIKNVVGSKFLYMYYSSLFWTATVPIAMLIGYALSGNMTIGGIIMWIIMIPFLPIIPMILASAIGIFIAFTGTKSRNKTMVRTVLTIIIIIPLMFSGTIISNYIEKNGVEVLLNQVSGVFDTIAAYLPTAKLFISAVKDNNVVGFILLIVITIVMYELFFMLVSKSYRSINSKLSEGSVNKDKKKSDFSQRKIYVSIAIKEWKRMLSSTTYMANAFVGEIVSIVLGIAVLFISPDTIIAMVFHDAPITAEMMISAVPFIVYFFLGMVATTAITPSIEGKNYWIIKSLPIESKEDCKGKSFFNLCLMIPAGVFSVTLMSIAFGASGIGTLLNICIIIALSFFSTTYGLFCGIKHRRLDWENEIEVVKQGAALMLYMFPNMFLDFILLVGIIILGVITNAAIIQIVLIPVFLLLSFLFWKKAVKIA